MRTLIKHRHAEQKKPNSKDIFHDFMCVKLQRGNTTTQIEIRPVFARGEGVIGEEEGRGVRLTGNFLKCRTCSVP